mgnify:CR=1 FL=1
MRFRRNLKFQLCFLDDDNELMLTETYKIKTSFEIRFLFIGKIAKSRGSKHEISFLVVGIQSFFLDPPFQNDSHIFLIGKRAANILLVLYRDVGPIITGLVLVRLLFRREIDLPIVLVDFSFVEIVRRVLFKTNGYVHR